MFKLARRRIINAIPPGNPSPAGHQLLLMFQPLSYLSASRPSASRLPRSSCPPASIIGRGWTTSRSLAYPGRLRWTVPAHWCRSPLSRNSISKNYRNVSAIRICFDVMLISELTKFDICDTIRIPSCLYWLGGSSHHPFSYMFFMFGKEWFAFIGVGWRLFFDKYIR